MFLEVKLAALNWYIVGFNVPSVTLHFILAKCFQLKKYITPPLPPYSQSPLHPLKLFPCPQPPCSYRLFIYYIC